MNPTSSHTACTALRMVMTSLESPTYAPNEIWPHACTSELGNWCGFPGRLWVGITTARLNAFCSLHDFQTTDHHTYSLPPPFARETNSMIVSKSVRVGQSLGGRTFRI